MKYLQSRFSKQCLITIVLYLFSCNYAYSQADTVKVNLSESDKTRIFLEEKYRNEIRKQFGNIDSNNWVNKVRSFFNSSFAIWFFPTFGIGLITFLYQKRQAKREKQKVIFDTLRRSFIEMENMIAEFDSAFNTHKKEKGKVWNRTNYAIFFENLLEGKGYLAVFPELAHRSFVSLALEANDLCSSRGQKKRLLKAIAPLKVLTSAVQNLKVVKREIEGEQPLENFSSEVDKFVDTIRTKLNEAKTHFWSIA